MSTRTSTRNGKTGPRKTATSKATPKAEPAKAAPKAKPRTQQSSAEPEAKPQKPFCGSCGSRLAPEDNDPFLGSPLLYDDSGFANLSGALFLCGWQSQTIQKVVDGRPAVTLVGTPVDANGKALPNRKIVTATWHHRTDIGWVQMAEVCGYSRSDGQGFQNRTAEQLVEYVGRNIAEWVLAPIDEAAEPKPKGKGKTTGSGGGKAAAKAPVAPEPDPKPQAPDESEAPKATVDPESKGLPQGSTPAPTEPEPAPQPEPEPEAVEPEPGDDGSSVEQDNAAAGVEEEVLEEGAAA
ncbi:hypothetical protein [Nocardia arizonensis]|uniref:hypothetical protein n=1 Tax=Nocardia arizonensis TaxID=1141647 RepID=UPI0006D1C92D|nr:hypothetical protein [Nocardia arizonensis]